MIFKKKVIAIVGPTGSGKTSVAVELAKKFNGVLVSADSRQVYKGLDIGTNKEGQPGQWHNHPPDRTQAKPARIIDDIPQLLIDVAEPGQNYSVSDWLVEARQLLPEIWAAGQLPIIVGGTGLYVSALLDGYQLGGGRGAKNNQPVDFQSLLLQIDVDRTILNQRSDDRFVKIFDNLIVEVKRLIASGVPTNWLEKIGLAYLYAFKHIIGQLSRTETIEQYQRASRQYIRRQLTWWRHHGQPILVKNKEEAIAQAKQFLES